MDTCRLAKRVAPNVFLLVTVSLLASGAGCGGAAATRDSDSIGFERGAYGDREVAEGPGLFSGKEGGLVFYLPGALGDRVRSTEGGQMGEYAPE